MTAPAYNVYAIQFAFAAFRKLTSLEEAGRYREAVRAAVLAYLAHLPASEALALSARPAAGSETRDRVDAERYRFLRDNPIQFRAVDGAAHFWGNTPAEHIDRWTDAARLAAVPPSPDATTGTE